MEGKTISVATGRPYTVQVARGIRRQIASLLPKKHQHSAVCLVSETHVAPFYLKDLQTALEAAGHRVVPFVFEAGEASKNPATLVQLLEFMCENTLTRTDLVMALGGGVTGDLAGLAAALYQRGMDFVQLPTSLLAMVDASVGGKTAVDLAGGKNQMGAFWQPIAVYCDPDFLNTLPQGVFDEGMAEVIKYAMLEGGELLRLLEEDALTADASKLTDMIALCVQQKAHVVAEDEHDKGARQFLNLGHTFGHGVEKAMEYTLPHGEGVAIGMALITAGCVATNRCDLSVLNRLLGLLHQYHLPFETALSAQAIMQGVTRDKKRAGEHITLVIPQTMGNCALYETNLDEAENLLTRGMDFLRRQKAEGSDCR